MHFKGSKKLKNRLKSIDLERDSDACATSYSPEQRKGRMLIASEEKEFFTAAQYMRLNGCNRSTAVRDLKELIEDGRIKSWDMERLYYMCPLINRKNMNNFSGTEKHAFSKIYLIYFPKLVRFAREYVVSIEDAENIVQDIFMYLWEHRDMLESLTNLNAFLFTLAKTDASTFIAIKH